MHYAVLVKTTSYYPGNTPFPDAAHPTIKWGCNGLNGGSPTASDACVANIITCIDSGLHVWNGSKVIHIAGQPPTGTITSPLRIKENGGIWGLVLIDPSNPLPTDLPSSGMRIQVSTGASGLRYLAQCPY